MTTDSNSSEDTQTEGAKRPSDDNRVFHLEDLDKSRIFDYSTSSGPVVEGDDIQVGLMYKEAGTGSQLHEHSTEQFTFVVKGELEFTIGDEVYDVPKGSVAHIPPHTHHGSVAKPGEDVVAFYAKDTSSGFAGNLVDESVEGPAYIDDDQN